MLHSILFKGSSSVTCPENFHDMTSQYYSLLWKHSFIMDVIYEFITQEGIIQETATSSIKLKAWRKTESFTINMPYPNSNLIQYRAGKTKAFVV